MINPKLQKIAVVGPESTGKSAVAQFLAQQLHTVCVPEYARYYCQHLNNQYTVEDEVNMFYGQIALEEALFPLAKNHLLICDTTIMTVKIWCDYLFGDTPKHVKDEIATRHYNHYLLMDIDLPWEDDPLRDFPDQREHFLEVWKKELGALGSHYTVISGQGDARFENAFHAIKKILT